MYNKFLFRQEEGTKATNANCGNNLESRIRLRTRTRYAISRGDKGRRLVGPLHSVRS